MPYATLADLPDRVKQHVPKHAQEIFRSAFNSALKQYGDEQTAFKVAWAAVHRNYGDPGNPMWHKEKPFKYESEGKRQSKSVIPGPRAYWDALRDYKSLEKSRRLTRSHT